MTEQTKAERRAAAGTPNQSARRPETGRGLVPWLEFGDVESQLRILRPAVLRKFVAASMLPIYALLAQEHGYRVATDALSGQGVRLVLWRGPTGPARVMAPA
jgi:hypothetical protein